MPHMYGSFNHRKNASDINLTNTVHVISKLLTVLPDIHTDGVRRSDVSIGRFHGSTGIPHIKEEENRDRREAEDGKEGQEEDVGQEHELRRGDKWK